MKTAGLSGIAPVLTLVLLALAAGVGQGAQPVADTALTTQGARTGEVSFGDLAADALCEAGSAPVALLPAVAFRPGSFGPGPFDEKAIESLLANPGDTVAVSRLTGAQLRRALERSLSRLPLPSGAFLQVAGLTVTYDPGARRGHRIKKVLVAGSPLQESRSYEVAMPLSLAKGGSGYFQIFDAGDLVRQETTTLAAALFSYAQKRGHVSYTGQGRLIPAR